MDAVAFKPFPSYSKTDKLKCAFFDIAQAKWRKIPSLRYCNIKMLFEKIMGLESCVVLAPKTGQHKPKVSQEIQEAEKKIYNEEAIEFVEYFETLGPKNFSNSHITGQHEYVHRGQKLN